MLDFLHEANDALGSLLLFIVLIVAWLALIIFLADEIIGLFIKDEPKKKPQENNDDDFVY